MAHPPEWAAGSLPTTVAVIAAAAPVVRALPAQPAGAAAAPLRVAPLDLKQTTAALFYALGRGWLPMQGMGAAEYQTEHIRSDGGPAIEVLVCESERSRALVSASITGYARQAGSAVRDSYPSSGVTWQKILDHLTKSGRGKFESSHRGKVTAGSWRRYELKQNTAPSELLGWVRQLAPHVPCDSVHAAMTAAVAVDLKTEMAAASAAEASGTGSAAKTAGQLQLVRSQLLEETLAHSQTRQQLQMSETRCSVLEMQVHELQQALTRSRPATAPTSPTGSDAEDNGEEDSWLSGSAAAAPAAQPPHSDAMVARGVKRHVSPSRADQQPADLYGRRRLWRVVTPLDGSAAASAAVSVEGFAGLPSNTSPDRDDDEAMSEDKQEEQEEQEDERGDGEVPALDAGWAPTHLGPIFFGP